MSGIIQKRGDIFEAGKICFKSGQVGLNFKTDFCKQSKRQELAEIIIQQEEEFIQGWVWLCSDQVLELQIGKCSCLIADQVEGLSDAFKKTLGFFFS